MKAISQLFICILMGFLMFAGLVAFAHIVGFMTAIGRGSYLFWLNFLGG